MKSPEINVAVYLRVSTHEQATNGWSIEGQLKEIREYCDRDGYKVVRIYKDLGYSGSNTERPGLQRLLEHSWFDFFDKVVIWKYDRLSRNDMDFPALLHFLNKKNIEVVSVKEPTPNDNSPYNDFVVGILGLLSSLERKTIMMRSKMGRRIRAEKGLFRGGMAPYGYSYNENTGYLEINPEEAEAVKIIFNKYLECMNYLQVARFLEEKGIPPRKADYWEGTTIKLILTKRIYIGEYSEGEFVHHFDDYKIIDDELFFEVQKRIGAGKTPPYGYEWDFEQGKIVPKQEEVEVVRRMFEIFHAYGIIPKVVDYLKETSPFKEYRKRNLYDTAVIRILTNPIYIGYQFGQGKKGEIIQDDSLRIIDKELYMEVQLVGERRYKTFRNKQDRIERLREKLIEEMFGVGLILD